MPPIDGLVLIDKPTGPSSHDIVRRLQRIVGAERAGHTGTLDPMASGLLVILLGTGTRLARFVPDHPKTYLATITFGTETDTDDATGSVVREDPLPAPMDVEAATARLTGPLQQVPPAYSARKVQGRRAYSLARRGTDPQLAPTTVQVHGWEVLSVSESTLTARIQCSRGTYIRALARDLGRMTNSAAHLSALRR
ncbi:MAG: tRNA pseudouridine(55) synthase TruB, partial [Gemmatimonadota bacterium]